MDVPQYQILNISIHALLAESDKIRFIAPDISSNFYPRSPCGERLRVLEVTRNAHTDFYPRSPCGERPCITTTTTCTALFLSTLSLRRATVHYDNYNLHCVISIHALLAESDAPWPARLASSFNFYPRSPCGERRFSGTLRTTEHKFLSTLSLRRATWLRCWQLAARDISIHALLAESDATKSDQGANSHEISIHALLAESDGKSNKLTEQKLVFLSTLSLRRATVHYDNYNLHCTISIHALLAESDKARSKRINRNITFLSTLSLRRATEITNILKRVVSNFYPRSPCGERRLAGPSGPAFLYNFYPRSPCGERRRAL